jgi:mannan endo-1,4-beta-mannosidase
MGTTAFAADSIHLEAENGELVGTRIETELKGFSGRGYVNGFEQDSDTIRLVIPITKAGLYDVSIRYHADEEKGFGLIVNGTKLSGMFPASGPGFKTSAPMKVELKAGTNTLSIEKGWGWYELDAFDIVPAKVSTPLMKPPATLVDKKATPATRKLMQLLVSQYGQKMLSGQYDSENAYVKQLTGKTPAIYGSDLIEYSPSRPCGGAGFTHGPQPSM